MRSYEELKTELETISKVIDKFPEAIKPRAFELLVQAYTGQSVPTQSSAKEALEIVPPSIAGRKKKRNGSSPKSANAPKAEKPAPKRAVSASFQIDRELNLRGDKSIPAFKAFVEEKKPDSAKKFNAVAAYYLQKLLGLSKITLDHCYTCYKEAGRRPPEAFRQSFIDTKNKEGWVEFDKEGDLRVTHRGSVFVEHDLPPIASAKKKAK